MKSQLLVILFTIACCVAAEGSDTLRLLTLEQCREMALRESTTAQIDQETQAAATAMRKAALAAMFPKFGANAAYTYKTGETHLLANQSEFSFGTVTAHDENGNATFKFSDSRLEGTLLEDIEDKAGQLIADTYQELYDRLSPDMRHIVIAQVGVTQPLYLGGRLIELYKIAKAAERIAGVEQDAHKDQLILQADEAFWRVVDVEQKKRLAENYLALLQQLETDVTTAAEAGLCTQQDLWKVRVKRSEAESKLLQASNGLKLSKMALCQVCGLPLEEDIQLSFSLLDSIPLLPADSFDAALSTNQRSELLLLDEAAKIARSNARIAAAGLQPNLVASANYIYTNPNVEDGFSNNWKGKGFFTAGVVLNVPIAHADDILRMKAAKHTAQVAELRKEEAAKLLTLQATQSNQKLTEAMQTLQQAQLNIKNAEENLRYAQDMFASGLLTASEVLQAQTTWLAAQTELIEAQVGLRMAETYFRKHTGTLQ